MFPCCKYTDSAKGFERGVKPYVPVSLSLSPAEGEIASRLCEWSESWLLSGDNDKTTQPSFQSSTLHVLQ